jgi:hypothetical protein
MINANDGAPNVLSSPRILKLTTGSMKAGEDAP